MNRYHLKQTEAYLRECLKNGEMAITVVLSRDLMMCLYSLAKQQLKRKIVHCKKCMWRGTSACFCKAKDDVQDDWFCSEGEKRE